MQLKMTDPKIAQFLYFLVDRGMKIDLMTYEYFSEKKCNEKFLVTLNSFNIGTQKWTTELKLHKIYHSFHNCLITVKSSLIYYNRRFDEKFTGFIFDFMDSVGKFKNFRVHRLPNDLSLNNLRKSIRNKLNNTKKSKVKFFRRPDVYLISDSLLGIINEDFHITSTFTEVIYDFIITPAESYSSYEKILLPFDAATWSMILLTFTFAFSDIIYGKNIKMPALNVASIFLGIAQARTPKEMFPRIILLIFI